MKIKNDDLGLVLMKLNSLNGLKIKGNIQLAVVDLKNKIKARLSVVEESMKKVCEAYCQKGDDDKPVTESEQVQHGTYIKYKFETPELENKCKEEMGEIGNEETDFTVNSSSVTEEYIGDIECTGEQTEALLMMIVKPTMVKA